MEEMYDDNADGRMNNNTSTIPTPKTVSEVHAAKMVGSMSLGVFWPVALYKEHHGSFNFPSGNIWISAYAP